jgi:hypothetical protein
MEAEWENGLIKRLVLDQLKGDDWGAETADRRSFFTLTGRPYGCRIRPLACIPIENGFVKRLETVMAEGRWQMEIQASLDNGTVRIHQTIECLEDSIFQDFVVRFRFDRSSFDRGLIAGRIIPHADRNVWHQYPVREAVLTGPHGTVRVRALQAVTVGKFEQMMYVRDEPGSWIVHVRLIPSDPPDLYWIRWAHRFGTWSINDPWSRRFLRSARVKRALWYLSERRGGRPQLQAQGLAMLRRGQRIAIQAECELWRGVDGQRA